MKHKLPIILALTFNLQLSTFNSIAQSLYGNLKRGNFYVIKDSLKNYFKNEGISNRNQGNDEDDMYLQFQRWVNFVEPRVYPTGNFPDPTLLQKEYKKQIKKQSISKHRKDVSANWQFIGNDTLSNYNGGAGRINCMAFSPIDTGTIFAGAASGGLWVTHNGGKTWSTTTDLLPNLAISDIAINPRDPDTMYVVTGDKYDFSSATFIDGGLFSQGIMMSADGGLTWDTTGLSYPLAAIAEIQRLLIYPPNPNILIAASRFGDFRTTDAGKTWISVPTSPYCYDMAFNASNPDTIYGVGDSDVFISSDAGQSWSILAYHLFGIVGPRSSICTTPANPNYIYVLGGNNWFIGFLYKSTDGGKSWIKGTYPTNARFYGYYDEVLSVSPTNPNTLYCGGLELVKSTDGGMSWYLADDINNAYAPNYIHVDKHAMLFYPGSNDEILCANDGGVWKTTDSDGAWSNLSSGLIIKQYYRLSSSSTNANYYMAGCQDNGTDRFNGNSWYAVLGEDGMEPLIDYTTDSINYASCQNGILEKSTNYGNKFVNITPPDSLGGDSSIWTSPYLLNPVHHNTILAGYSHILRSYDGGNSWKRISPKTTDDYSCIKIAPSDTNYIYACSYFSIVRSIDNGQTWKDITGTLPINNSLITWISVSSINPDKIWVTFSGYIDSIKVYSSSDTGNTWNNYSDSLPNIPVNCIEYQPSSPDILYIGTDLGVYERDSTMQGWEFYNNGLPNVIIDELQVVPYINKLRAATFGRSLWETDLLEPIITQVSSHSISLNTAELYPNPNNGNFTLVSNLSSSNYILKLYDITGREVFNNDIAITQGKEAIDVSGLNDGIYFWKVESANTISGNGKIVIIK